MSSSPPELDRAEVVHRLAGRVRIRVAARRGDAAWFARTVEALGTVPGITHCAASPLAASIVVHHCEPLTALADAFAQRGLLDLDLAPSTAPSPAVQPQALLKRVDDAVRALTGGRANFATAASAALFALGAAQVARGQILPQAATLFWYGFETLRRSLDQATQPTQEPPAE